MIRRIGLAALFALLLCICGPSSRAQFNGCAAGFCGQVATGGGGSSPTLTIGKTAFVANSGAGGTITFTGLNNGVNFPSGAAVYVLFYDDDGIAPTTPLIGGQTPTKITGASDGAGNKTAWYFAVMPAPEADTFSVANGASYNKVQAVAVYMTNVTATPTASSYSPSWGCCSGTQQPAASITVPATGFGVAGVGAGCGFGSLTTQSWVGGVVAAGGDVNGFGNGCVLSVAHTATAGAGWLPGVTGSSSFDFIAGVGSFAVGP